ncbi:MAG TPA: metallophosphoesterase [Polyangiaceae bacterium]|nr:metallophosphoesterase [Polyangiaceae bacterium]
MSSELRTSLRSQRRFSRVARQCFVPSLTAALLALSIVPAGCDGDDETSVEAGAGGTDGTDAPPRDDGAVDRARVDQTGEMEGGGPEAGDREVGSADQSTGDVDATTVDDADDRGRDAAEAPVAPPRDVAYDAEDASLDGVADAPFDAADASADVPRDAGPIVIGPPFRRSARFAVFGDYGMASTDEARVSNLVHSWDPDFVITTGDNNYTGLSDGIDGVIGRYYSDFIGNYGGVYGSGSQTTRFWPSPGNHDWDVADLTPYIDYFTLPGNERYYDIGLGLVHLFAVDSDPREPDGTTADSVQARWLQASLARSTSCFNVVYFHHPAYSSGPHGSSFEMRWPFEAWGADVVLAGHDHVYERFEVGQIPYFTVGLGGGSPYTFVTTVPESRAQFNSDFGAMLVTANRRGMLFEFFDANGALVESFLSSKRCR